MCWRVYVGESFATQPFDMLLDFTERSVLHFEFKGVLHFEFKVLHFEFKSVLHFEFKSGGRLANACLCIASLYGKSSKVKAIVIPHR